jgi:glycine cleavage system transcriptional repressor
MGATRWHMLTIIGEDRPGIVAAVTQALFEGGCNLGETSMIRLGGNFTIMMMVAHPGDAPALAALAGPAAKHLGLHLHVVPIEGKLHAALEPDVRVTVFGADRPGIVAQVTGALATAGLNIVNLDSHVGGSPEQPIYIMQIEGRAGEGGLDAIERSLDEVKARGGVDVRLAPIDALYG